MCDGPREHKEGENEKVLACKKLVEEGVDWPCEFVPVYAEKNMGCKKRMASGITEVFLHEELASILEDDCVPAPAFFPFVQENLLKYKNNEEIMLVSGTLNLPKFPMADSYTFSKFASIWGWGSFARAWEQYDVRMADWPEIKRSPAVRSLFGPLEFRLFCRDAEGVYSGKVDTWDMQWLVCVLKNGTGVVPSANLIRNIGCGRPDATHTKDRFREIPDYGSLQEALRHPAAVKENYAYDQAYTKATYGMKRVLNKLSH